MPNRTKDLTGQKFGQLTAVKLAGYDTRNNARWWFRCDCGNEKVMNGSRVSTGRVLACGCQHKPEEWNRTHGQSNSKTYHAWMELRARCQNPKHQEYAGYGGRGITVCDRWQHFENFRADMGDAPAGLQIDRINNDLGYSPDNCRWATRTQQARNRRGNRLITFQGETLPVVAWAERLGVRAGLVYLRLYHGWNVERALLCPVRGCK